jgi:hypothetical protein
MRRRRVVSIACALSAMLPVLGLAQLTGAAVRVGEVAEKLGVKGMPNGARELEPGQSATMMLEKPGKLEPYGIKGMHEGARVTITCVGPNRVRVEADEMDPTPRSTVVTLKVQDDGSLVQVQAPERAPPPKPPRV